MANLAIRGHATRGKEVIEILEMLGGTNRENCWGVFENRLYLINSFGDIEDISLRDNSNYQIYTLEEFLKKFPYKVGDKVIDIKTNRIVEIYKVHWSESNNCTYYDVKLCNNTGYVRSYKFLQPYKEETMESNLVTEENYKKTPMTNLAIKGHSTRGKEVIEILEMLGGKISHECRYKDGFDSSYLFFINTDENFYIDGLAYNSEELKNYDTFTLEEFLEKFPYKVGDKVKVPYEDGRITGNELYEYKILKIKWDDLESTIKYGLPTGDEQRIEYYSTDNLNIWNKKEIMEDIIKIYIPKGYEFAGVDDDNQQVVFTKIQPEYPKTYGECCEILGIRSDWHLTLELDTPATHDLSVTKEFDYVIKLELLRKLSICRDAYWKIAGEQMGLGKPWEPDFTNNDEERYGIYTLANKVEKDFCGVGDVNTILVFPTEEMRDAFLDSEEIAQLIEICKEFL